MVSHNESLKPRMEISMWLQFELWMTMFGLGPLRTFRQLSAAARSLSRHWRRESSTQDRARDGDGNYQHSTKENPALYTLLSYVFVNIFICSPRWYAMHVSCAVGL